MTDQNDLADRDEPEGGIQLVRPTPSPISMEASTPPLIEEFSDPRRVAGGSPASIRFEVRLLEDTEHALLQKLAKRHGRPMTIMLREMLMRGLRLQEEVDAGREIAVTQGRQILFKVL